VWLVTSSRRRRPHDPGVPGLQGCASPAYCGACKTQRPSVCFLVSSTLHYGRLEQHMAAGSVFNTATAIYRGVQDMRLLAELHHTVYAVANAPQKAVDVQPGTG